MSLQFQNEYDMAALLQEAIECLPYGFSILDEELRPLIGNKIIVDAFPEYFEAMAAGAHIDEANFAGVRRANPNASDEECWRIARAITAHIREGKTIHLRAFDGRIFKAMFRCMNADRYVAVYIDMSEEKRREKELERLHRQAETASRAKSAFLATMSHEIRTPLNGILGMAQVLAQDMLDEELREQIDIILESGNTLRSLLDGILDLTKIEAGHMELAPVDTDLLQLLRRQHSLWLARAAEKNIALVLEVASGVPARVSVDPIRLGQCLSNLISNAIKFTVDGEVRIAVLCRRTAKGILVNLAISDTGMGMSGSTLKRLFTPFAQADSSISRHFGGTGLGLVITRKLAQIMGGDVTVESREGHGSIFRLSVLCQDARDDAPEQAPEISNPPDRTLASRTATTGRILLVDDHPVNRRVGRMFLTPAGYEVVEAEDGQQALDRLELESFDLVLLDIHMPVLDGVATIKRIRDADRPWRAIPVIALTADAMSGSRERYLADGMNAYIAKPIDRAELLGEVERLIGARAAPATQSAATAPAAQVAAPPAAREARPAPAIQPSGEQSATGTSPGARNPAEYNLIDLVQEAIEILPDGFAIIDHELRPLITNAPSRATFKHYYDAVTHGMSYRDANYYSVRMAAPAITEQQAWQWVDFLEETIRAGEAVEMRPAEGVVCRTIYRPMSGGRYVAVSIDITEERTQQAALKQARQQAEAANKAKTAFLANMSHEIRTPLNGILGMAQVMVQSGLAPQQLEQAEAIMASGQALKALLDDVLDLAKIDAGQMALLLSDTNIAQLLERQRDHWLGEAKRKGIDITLTVEPDLPADLPLDAVRLGQCLSNLISNAVKFTERGAIDIRASARDVPEGTEIEVSVADTGIGMDADVLAHLFSPFTQADSSISRRYGGSGLGLVISQKLANLMGGEVTVESEKNRGSTFTLKVIARTQQAAPSAAFRLPLTNIGAWLHGGSGRQRILYVDDHPVNRRIGRLFLEPEGYEVVEAENGGEALERLAAAHFDLVLLDIRMPILDGPDTLKAIRGSGEPWKDVFVIALEASSAPDDRERFLRDGMDGYVAKPLDQRNLLAEIGRLLGTSRLHAAPEPANFAEPVAAALGRKR